MALKKGGGGGKRASWQQRMVRRNGSVVQTIFNREMGFPQFSRSGDLMSNGMNEGVMGRQLLKGRIPDKSDALRPEGFNMNPNYWDKKRVEDRKASGLKCDRPQRWFRLNLDNRDKIYYVSGLLWRTTALLYMSMDGNNRKVYFNTFYKLLPDPAHGFKTFDAPKIEQGNMEDVTFISYRAAEGPSSTFVASLTETGTLTLTDVSCVSRINHPIILKLKSDHCTNVRFTDMTVDYNQGLIYVIGGVNGYCKQLSIISFTSWAIDTVIHVMIPLRIHLAESVLLAQNGNQMELSDLSGLIELSKVKPPSSKRTEEETVRVRTLRKRPSPIASVPTLNEYFGVLEASWPPLYFYESKLGMHIQEFGSSKPIWTCKTDPYVLLQLEQLPDNSNSMFVCKDDNQFLVTWTKQKGKAASYAVTEHNPFLGDASPQNHPKRPPLRSQRPRACKSAKKYSEKCPEILCITHCEGLDLLAVCSAMDTCLLVTLYEPRTFKVFKRLPPVVMVTRPRPPFVGNRLDSQDGTPSKFDKISRVSLNFDFELFLLEVKYDFGFEVFCIRLLEEEINED